MLNLRDLRIDPASLGRKMLLVDVMPAYEYKDGKRTETVSGYRYVVCLAEHRLEKLSVRIDGPQQMEQPEGFVDVEFTDLVVTGYESQGKLQFSAKASGIFLADYFCLLLRTRPRDGWGLIFFPKEKYPPASRGSVPARIG